MKSTKKCRIEISSILCLPMLIANFTLPAYAQEVSSARPPMITFNDSADLDLSTGQNMDTGGVVKIGQESDPALSLNYFLGSQAAYQGTPLNGAVWQYCTAIPNSSCSLYGYEFQMGNHWEQIPLSPPSTTGLTNYGSVYTRSGQAISLTQLDGTVWNFTLYPSDDQTNTQRQLNGMFLRGYVSSIVYPDGKRLDFAFSESPMISTITSNMGYQLRKEFTAGATWSDAPSKITLINLAIDYCGPVDANCTPNSLNWPKYQKMGNSYGSAMSRYYTTSAVIASDGLSSNITKTSPAGVKSFTTGAIKNIVIAGEDSSLQFSYTFCPGTFVVIKNELGSKAWNYAYTFQKGGKCALISTTATAPDGGVTMYTASGGGLDYSIGSNEATVLDPLGRTTNYKFFTVPDTASGVTIRDKIKEIVYPDGSKETYTEDARLNITSRVITTPAGVAQATGAWAYASSCDATNRKICNQPQSFIDANGNESDYSYDPNSGLVTSVLSPAAANGVRAQKRMSYQQLYARYKDASGAIVNSAYPVWRLVSTSSCKMLASCTGTSDEVIEQISYDGNLLPITKTVKLGDGTLLSTVTTAYDAVGNVISVDGPAVGSDDTTYYFYDDDRESVGEIGPDPDGTGALQRPAKRRSYNADGKLLLEEVGTASGITQASLTAMTVKQFTRNTYDAATGRLVKTEVGAP